MSNNRRTQQLISSLLHLIIAISSDPFCLLLALLMSEPRFAGRRRGVHEPGHAQGPLPRRLEREERALHRRLLAARAARRVVGRPQHRQGHTRPVEGHGGQTRLL